MSGLIRVVFSLIFLLFGGYSQLNAHAYREAACYTEINSSDPFMPSVFKQENRISTGHLKTYSHSRLHKRFCTTDPDDQSDDDDEVSSKKQVLFPKYLLPAFYALLLGTMPASTVQTHLPDGIALFPHNQIFLRLGIIRI